ncbi:MAG TPA: MATE family efflux transporter [Chloroflexota bacterium]|jgi:putative MATE family efflux protein|nr:MATE family efflux transporter [Chloroflexota bacterium]
MKATLPLVAQQRPQAVADGPPASATTQRILDGPILTTLLRMALPNIILVVVQALSSAVDAFYLGRLGPDVLAGVALVFPVWMLMVTTSAGALGGGISAAVARALGGGRRDDANALVAHSLLLATAVSLLFSAVVLLGGPILYQAMGGSNAALNAAIGYSTAIFAGALFVWLVNALASLLRGSGEMLAPALVIVGGELLHIVLAPLLIFGLGPFPALGVAGAGVSLVTSYAIRAVVLGGYLLGRRAAVSLPRNPLKLRADLFWDILRVGLPGAVNTLMTNVNVMAITTLVGSSGVLALAGYGLAARLEYLQIPLVFGFGTALVTMVGTNIGAGQVQRARRVAWIGAGVAAVATGSVGLFVAVLPELWLGLFTSEPAVRAVGETYLRIVGPTYAFFGLGLALYFAAQGAGQLTPALLAGFGRLVVAVAGGWLVLNWLHLDLPWLFASIGVAFVLFGVAQALAVNSAIRGVATARPAEPRLARTRP